MLDKRKGHEGGGTFAPKEETVDNGIFWRCSKDRQLSVTKMAQVKQVTGQKAQKAANIFSQKPLSLS